MVTEPPQLRPGMLLAGRFTIGELLGAGGMGQVFAAHDRLKGQDIAIKVLSPELVENTHARDRFLVEARICCDLSHDNIVRVYDVAQCGPHIYFTMERLYGKSLRHVIGQCKQEQRPMPLKEVMHITLQLLTALRYAHGRKVVHRDIKPENIWLCADEASSVKLMDFGIARALASSDLTRTGIAMGTPYYMAPEQWLSAKDVDARADQYSLAVVLYELLTRVLPATSRAELVAGVAKPLSGFRDRLREGSCGPVMIVIPASEFLMGSPGTEVGHYLADGLQHRVTLQSFALAQTETTFEDYDRFARATARKLPDDARGWGRANRPVINISWRDATAYAQWLSKQTGERYRLPTEAEWEYAARARTTTPFSTGECISIDQANFNGNYPYATCTKSNRYLNKTQPVAAYPANSFKLHDLHGNVREWMQDCVHTSYATPPGDGSAWLEQDQGDCSHRVLRGGSWYDSAHYLRSAYRLWVAVDGANFTLGFRVARTP
jgi:formylglycine-generating enzyme required for sulfatase activity